MVARILRQAGLYTGLDLNESEDAIALGVYSDRWINQYLAHRGGRVPASLGHEMRTDLARVLDAHCAPLRHAPQRWGWKEPRCIYLLPFLREQLPALRFVHVVRDGRDMALSSNQNQLRKHADAAGIPPDLPDEVRSIALWGWINRETTNYARECLPARYLCVRFEDLCERPAETASNLFAFLELQGDPAAAAELVDSPPTLRRWQTADAALVASLERTARDALQMFGYELSQ